MKALKQNATFTQTVRKSTAAALIAGLVLVPSVSSAGLLDRAQQAKAKVTQLKNKVQAKAENIQDKAEDFKGEKIEQLMEMVTSMLDFVRHEQQGYKNFVGGNKCGRNSPCAGFRTQLRETFETFVRLPEELPFVETTPPAIKQLAKIAKLVDHIPPPMLYVAEKVLGNMFDEIGYRLEVVQYAAAKLPSLPSMAELAQLTANSPQTKNTSTSQQSKSAYPFCSAVLDTGKPHIELLQTAINALHETISDVASVLPNEQTVGITVLGGGTVSIKHPAKGGLDVVVVVIKAIERKLTLRLALVKSVCSLSGYQGQ